MPKKPVEIQIYTTTTCPSCVELKRFLNEQHVEYIERNIVTWDTIWKVIVKNSGINRVPVITLKVGEGRDVVYYGYVAGKDFTTTEEAYGLIEDAIK